MNPRIPLAWLVLLVGTAAAAGEPGEPGDIRVTAGAATINWTRLVVEAEGSRSGSGTGTRQQAIEQTVRSELGPAIQAGAETLRVDDGHTLGDLVAAPGTLGEAIRGRFPLWTVVEARYYASGRVELLGELDIREILKPWALSVAPPAPRPGPTRFTGLVVDARGLDVTPAYAPRLVTPEGQVLFAGLCWEDRAVATAPVVYVPTAAHPAGVRAGATPLFARASAARGVDLVVAPEDVAAVTELAAGRLLGDGTVVVVVDAPG